MIISSKGSGYSCIHKALSFFNILWQSAIFEIRASYMRCVMVRRAARRSSYILALLMPELERRKSPRNSCTLSPIIIAGTISSS